jgi:extracellular elastinolytic metalloproteinase
MTRELDTREFNFEVDKTRTKNLFAAAESVTKSLPGSEAVKVSEVDAFTGTPRVLTAENSPPAKGSLIERALNYVNVAQRAFGFAEGEPAEFVPDPHVMETSAGTSVVNLHQYYRGIPVFEMARTVRFSSNREITDAVGANVTLPPGLDIMAKLDPGSAVLAAAQFIATPHEDEKGVKGGWGRPVTPPSVDLSGFAPSVISAFPLPSRPTVLAKGPFEKEIPAYLIWFYQGPRVRLGWHVMLTMPRFADQFAVIVSADGQTGEILYCQRTILHTKGQGMVFQESPGRTPRNHVFFPPPSWADYPDGEGIPGAPPDWVTVEATEGNNVIALLGDTGQPFQGRIDGGRIEFEPADELGDDQKVVNIFYFTNYLRDFFYLLGFDEAHGNFQEVNFSGQGLPADAVQAHAYNEEVQGVAYFAPTAEGEPPTMVMGLYGDRSTALDADVVFHEFTHGVTNRVIGGPMGFPSLTLPQSRGMGEGWSDYFALTIQNYGKPTERVITGNWTANNAEGIRRSPYDEHYPLNFGDVGKDENWEVHNIGEIWCATLMQMNRNMTSALGSQKQAYRLAWQIVFDSLKLMQQNPSFLNARDAMVKGLDDLRTADKVTADEFAKVRKALWSAFAKFGMGVNASCPSANLGGIKANFDLPQGL